MPESAGAIEPHLNRLILYDGTGAFHGSNFDTPQNPSADPGQGRLTWNGFFACRRAASALTGDASA
jgi:hypothetical protein